MMKSIVVCSLVLVAAACSSSDNNSTNNTTANNTTANNTTGNTATSNNVASGGGFVATATYDGMTQDFNCTTFEASDGNIASYTAAIDLYLVQCRSTSGTHQIKVAIPAPMVGETRDTVAGEGEVAFGPIDTGNLNLFAGTPVSQSITIDSFEAGTAFKGSFAGEWSGDAMLAAGDCSGTFDITIP